MKLVSLYFIFLFPVLFGVVSCTLNEADQPVKIFGRITGSDGNGIGGVDVLVKRGEVEQSVITSDNGRYELVLPDAGQIEMTFSKSGYTSHEKSLVLLGGEKKRVDLILHTLSEDAYFNFAPAEVTFYNTGGSAIAYINTNVSFEQESVPSWLTVNVEGTTLTIQCDSNETHDARLGYIVYNAAYNLRDTMIVRQLAGPVLKLVNYWGSDSSGFSHEKPFVAFSEEIEVVSATSSGSNLEFELSDDKKTVYFNQIKIGAFSHLPVSLKVKASDNIQLSFDVNFKLFINSTPFVGPNGQKILFTNDNKYIWIFSHKGSQQSLVQYSSADFSEQ